MNAGVPRLGRGGCKSDGDTFRTLSPAAIGYQIAGLKVIDPPQLSSAFTNHTDQVAERNASIGNRAS